MNRFDYSYSYDTVRHPHEQSLYLLTELNSSQSTWNG